MEVFERESSGSGRFYALLIVKVITIIGGKMPTSETLMDDGDKPLRRKVAGCNGVAAFRSVVYAKTVVFDNMRRKCFLALAPKIQKILAIHTAVTFAALNVWRNGVFRHKISFLNVLKRNKSRTFCVSCTAFVNC